jgi:hypothetical protein
VDNPSNSRADAAYDKAFAAYQEKSFEVARRWVVEALAHNRQHAGARALLGRLDAARNATSPFHAPASGSEVVSTDPTILISRAAGAAPASEPIEPTVMVRRDDPRYRTTDTDPRVTLPPLGRPRTNSHPVSEPTVIAQSKPRHTTSGQKTSSIGSALQSLGQRFQRSKTSRPPSPPRTRSSGSVMSQPAARGALLAVATVVVGALVVWALFLAVRWAWPAGQLLTITKPTGGTITGPGIECGSKGTRCSTTVTTGEPIELATDADKGFMWTGYTGDCAPTGRLSMNGPKTCGATFGPVVSSLPTPVTFRLTVTKPEGGTVVVAGGILCGTNGATCSAELPSGVPVDLVANADDGYQFEQFTGDCPSTGKTSMTSAKTCGAIFIRTAAPINRGGPVVPAGGPVTPRPPRSTPSANNNSGPGTQPGPSSSQQQAGNGPANAPGGNPGGTLPPPVVTPPPAGPDGPPKAAETAEEHAKKEILQLVNDYCAALGTLKPDKVRSLFHLDNTRDLKAGFKEYKSLKCTVASPPEYDRFNAGAAGGAQLKFGMKQAIQMASGGAPNTKEYVVTMLVSRQDFQSAWLIDRVQYDEKPK